VQVPKRCDRPEAGLPLPKGNVYFCRVLLTSHTERHANLTLVMSLKQAAFSTSRHMQTKAEDRVMLLAV
jgi:hypothetical protein